MTRSASEQAGRLATHAGYWMRPELRVLRVQGDDRLSWLNGQVTNDLRQLESEGSVHALAVHVRGKILAEVWVVARPDELLVVLPAASETALVESFERYIIMEDVSVVPWEEARVLAVLGPAAVGLAAEVARPSAIGFPYDDLGFGGYAFLGAPADLETWAAALRERGAVPIDDAGYELARLRAGVPRFGLDYGERTYPQEAGLKHLVSFAKGCYLGQEVVCTLENRGRLTRQLVALRSTGQPGGSEQVPPAGTALASASGDAAGELTSAQWDPDASAVLALAYVKRAFALPGATLTAAGLQLTLERVIGSESG